MNYIIFFSLIAIILSSRKQRNIANPVIAFSLLWITVFTLYSQSLYGIVNVNDLDIHLMIYGVIAFTLGSIIAMAVSYLFNKMYNKTHVIKSYSIRYKYAIAIAILITLYYLSMSKQSVMSLMNGSNFNDIRSTVQTSGIGSNGITNMIYNFFVLPMSYALEAIAVADWYLGEKNRKLIGLTFTITLLRVIADGGRTPIFDILMYIIVGSLIVHKKIKIDNSKKVKMLLGIVLSIIILGTVTISRTSSTVMRQIYFYFSMSPVLFSTWKNIVDMQNIYTMGLVSFNGIIFPVVYIFKNMFGLNYPSGFLTAYNLIANTDSIWQRIAQGRTFANAYVSSFWFLYTDFRFWGIVAGMMIYGIVMWHFYNKILLFKNVKNLSVYFLLYQGMFFSFIRFPFAKAYYILAFIYIHILISKRGYYESDKKLSI